MIKLKSSEPFWLIKNGSPHSYPSLREDAKTDILVVGAGITGALIAHQCIKDGYDTMLVDRREVSHGSTSATTSMLQYEIDTPLHTLVDMIGEKGAVASYRACSDAIDDLEKLCKKIRSGCGFKRKKSLYYAAFKKDIDGLWREYEVRKKYGFAVKWMEEDEIRDRFLLHEAYGGILSDQGASMDAFRFTHDLLAYNFKRGLRIYDKTEVKNPVYSKRSVTISTEYENTIQAKKIIYCTGFESVEIIPDNFVNLLSTYAIVGEQLESKPAKLDGTLFWNTARPYLYFRTTSDNRILIGGVDEKFINAKKRDRLLTRKSKQLEKHVKRLLPLHGFHTDFSWCGTFGETKDGLPYIGAHPKIPHSYFVLGFGGNGITFSVAGMQIISDLLKRKTPPLAKYFRFGR